MYYIYIYIYNISLTTPLSIHHGDNEWTLNRLRDASQLITQEFRILCWVSVKQLKILLWNRAVEVLLCLKEPSKHSISYLPWASSSPGASRDLQAAPGQGPSVLQALYCWLRPAAAGMCRLTPGALWVLCWMNEWRNEENTFYTLFVTHSSLLHWFLVFCRTLVAPSPWSLCVCVCDIHARRHASVCSLFTCPLLFKLHFASPLRLCSLCRELTKKYSCVVSRTM